MRHASLPDLAAFASIATNGNFRRAAAELQVSPSALSHRMRILEERLGVRLLNRTTRSVALTEAGEALLSRLQPALEDINQAMEEINAFRSSPVGTLRITAPRSAIDLVLAPVIGPFVQQYPGIKLEIVANIRFIDIVREGFDAGIRFQESLERDMIAVPLGPQQRFAVVVAPDYLDRHGIPLTPHDLHNHSCLTIRFPSGELYKWEFEKDGRELAVAVNGAITLSDQDLTLQAVKDGAGLACVFEPYALAGLADGSLVRVLEDWCPPFPGFFLYYPSRRQMPASLRAFIDMVQGKHHEKTCLKE